MSSLKPEHAEESIVRALEGLVWRWEVVDGSKPDFEGVRRALRFWTMESSMADREIRKKSAVV